MRYLLFIFFLLGLSKLFSQTLTVLDSETKDPVEYVSIVGLSSNIVISTNANGFANISQLKNDEKIIFRLIGYQSKTYNYANLQSENDTILLVFSPFAIPGIVVSATKWEQETDNIPHKISSIKRKDFQFQNPQTAADLLETSGEVFIQKSQQGGGSPMIRGFATNRLLYSVDGVRMNTAIFRSGNLQNVISLDPFSMESVEVLFGPGSIIYGSDAIGGVMSFTSKQASLSDSIFKVNGNANIRMSSANSEVNSHLDLSLSSKNWGLLSSFSRSIYGDLKMGVNGPSDYLRDSLVVRQNSQDFAVANHDNLVQSPSEYEQTNFMQKLLYKPNSKTELRYGFHYSKSSDFDRYDRLIQKRNGTFRFSENKYGPQKWIMNHLEVISSHKRKYFDKVKLNLAVQNFEESRVNRVFGDSLRRNRSEKVDAFSLNLDFTKNFGNKHQLFYGFEGVYNHVKSVGESINIINQEKESIQSRYPKSDWFSNALYLSDQYSFSERLDFDFGLRLNQYSLKSEFDSSFVSLPFQEVKLNKFALSGSFGLVFKANNTFVISSNLSTGFRSPNVDDIGKFFDPEPFSVVVPNSSLNAEYAYNFDLAFAKVVGDLIKLDLTFFYTLLDNALVRRDFTLNGSDSLFFDGENKKVQAIQNAAQATIYGVQTGIEFKFNSRLSWSTKLNFQKGEEELDDGSTSPSRHAAPLFGLSSINFKKKKLWLQLNIQYNAEVSNKNLNIGEQAKDYLYASDKNGKPYSPSWYSINFKSQYQLNNVLTASFGVENISNQRYRPYSSGVAGPGINLVFSVNAKF